MSGRFSVGDLIECVDARPPSWHEPTGETLAKGDVFRVARFVAGIPFGWGFPRSFVIFQGRQDALRHWDAYRFRKLNDHASYDFRHQLRSLGKHKERVDA